MTVSPVSERERIDSLDVIRGFALFGILLVNMPTYLHPSLFLPANGLPAGHTPLDEAIRLFLDMFVQTKFYTIFSFLFGAGFYLFMHRAQQKGVPVQPLFLRRMLLLLLMGLLHLYLFWYGDILHTYAIAGLILMLFYNSSKRTVHRWAWSLIILLQGAMAATLFIPGGSAEANQSRLAEQAIEVYNRGSWSEWLGFRWLYEIPEVLGNEVFALLSVLPLFLFGFSAAREGVFTKADACETSIRRIWRLSLVISIPLVAMIPLLKYGMIRFPASPEMAALVFVNWSGLSLCAFYICSLLLLQKKGTRLLKGLAAVGRMSLTHYLLQTVVFVAIVRIFSLYGSVSLTTGLLASIFLFLCQAEASRWWFSLFAFGPMEWVWRCCTYAKIFPLRKMAKQRTE